MGIFIKEETTPDYNKKKVTEYFKEFFEALESDLKNTKTQLDQELKNQKTNSLLCDKAEKCFKFNMCKAKLTPTGLTQDEKTALVQKGGKSTELYKDITNFEIGSSSNMKVLRQLVAEAHLVNNGYYDGRVFKSAVEIWRKTSEGKQTLKNIIEKFNSILDIIADEEYRKWPLEVKKPKTWKY